MFTVILGGEKVFSGGYSQMNAYILDTYGSHMAAVKAGVRMVPPAIN